MSPWSEDEWVIIQKCQDQEGHGYAAHAYVFSNHAYRYVPTLCDACRKIIEEMKGKRDGIESETER